MDSMDTSPPAWQENNPSAKRKRSPVDPIHSAPLPKVARTHGSHLQINYLARQYPDTIPLITSDDTLPSLLSLIGDYDGVLQRHESMAGNLGARPLGPILIKRFERLFDGPPRVLKSHGKEGTTVGWIDVVEFARNKPEQFNLEKMRDGVRVCQFYTKQSRIEITEEDFLLIASGMPQKLIPPQPILEDEEKELGTLEILEKNLTNILQLADQVSARARQLNHRLRNRKNAIISRREKEVPESPKAHTRFADMGRTSYDTNGRRRSSVSPSSGFVAVNSRQGDQQDSYGQEVAKLAVNGASAHGASAATRAELLGKFFITNERAPPVDCEQSSRRVSISNSRNSGSRARPAKPTSEPVDYAFIPANSASPVPIPNTPSSLLPYSKPSVDRFDDSGPYKVEMVSRMELLQRGDRVQPPCDRCRRLHMDCLKNLTACMGCTRKHAKCSWKDVNDEELRENPPLARPSGDQRASGDEGGASASDREGYQNLPTISSENAVRKYPRDERQGVADEELLGEDGSDDEEELPQVKPTVSSPVPKVESNSDSQQRNLVGSLPRYSEAQCVNGLTHNTSANANTNFVHKGQEWGLETERKDSLAQFFSDDGDENMVNRRDGIDHRREERMVQYAPPTPSTNATVAAASTVEQGK